MIIKNNTETCDINMNKIWINDFTLFVKMRDKTYFKNNFLRFFFFLVKLDISIIRNFVIKKKPKVN